VNSYKRLTTTAGTPTSGATWSPIFITHGANNRTQMLRLPGGHVTFGTGRSAFKHTMPRLAGWITAHSDERPDGEEA
jgi:glutamine synthetase